MPPAPSWISSRSRRAPALKELSYGVFALGDSSYPKFCETGRIVDERLAALGATRLHPRVDADLDYEAAGRRPGVNAAWSRCASEPPAPA